MPHCVKGTNRVVSEGRSLVTWEGVPFVTSHSATHRNCVLLQKRDCTLQPDEATDGLGFQAR